MKASLDNPIYALLPAVYRERDQAMGYPLAALSTVLDLAYEALRDDVSGMYEAWFIETCPQWVVPYIGELLHIPGIETRTANVETQRARVANTTGYRARRGIASVLANAASEASGWPALAVEYFQRVIVSANVQALSPTRSAALRVATVDVADSQTLASINGPFSTSLRSVDVRSATRPHIHAQPCTPEPYNLASLGLFYYRIRALPLRGSCPRACADELWSFHTLGIETALFILPADRSSPWAARTDAQVPQRITRSMLAARSATFRARRQQAGAASNATFADLGFSICVNGRALPGENIFACDRGGNFAPERLPLQPERRAIVDPERGVFRLYPELDPATEQISVEWAWGQPDWIGGGAYRRDDDQQISDDAQVYLVSKYYAQAKQHELMFATLADALAQALQPATEPAASTPRQILIRFLDSASYPAPRVPIALAEGERLTLEAVDGQRPTLTGTHALRVLAPERAPGARLRIAGLVIEPALEISGDLELQIVHCTLAPPCAAEAAITWEHGAGALQIVRSIVGPLRLLHALHRDQPEWHATIAESIVDGGGELAILSLGAGLVLDAVSVLGGVRALALEGCRDSIVTGTLRTRRLCWMAEDDVLFAYELVCRSLEDEEPGVTLRRASVIPANVFTSTRYGDPGYCQLSLHAGERILRGGSEDGELGAYHVLATGQRIANLEAVYAEYTPFGMQVGTFFIS